MPDADLDVAVAQCTLGSLSYNGQRCTAIKLVMVHASIADAFVEKLVDKVRALKVGLPWEENVAITPLPEPKKPQILESMISDAVSKGAELRTGGELMGQLMKPAVVDGVTPQMRLFHEEQFGPVVPVARFEHVDEVVSAIRKSWNGQQARRGDTHKRRHVGTHAFGEMDHTEPLPWLSLLALSPSSLPSHSPLS